MQSEVFLNTCSLLLFGFELLSKTSMRLTKNVCSEIIYFLKYVFVVLLHDLQAENFACLIGAQTIGILVYKY